MRAVALLTSVVLLAGCGSDDQAANVGDQPNAETAASKPTFRQAMSRRRCIVPASGFFEWKGKKGEKQAFLFRMRSSGLFGIAGLYETWLGVGGEVIDSVNSNDAGIVVPSDFPLANLSTDEFNSLSAQLDALDDH